MPRQRRSFLRVVASVLYHTSFSFFLLILCALLVSSAWGLSEQAWRSGGQRRWNIFALVATYVAVFIISIIHIWSRVLSVKKSLRTMPKPYVPIKQIDVPKKVSRHVATEYSRTAVIAHISQATTGVQEGWGKPNTKWDNVHFRTYILGTLSEMREILSSPTNGSESGRVTLTPPSGTDDGRRVALTSESRSESAAPPHSLEPLLVAADALEGEKQRPDGLPTPLRLLVNSYTLIIERARYGCSEPTEADASACDKVLEVVRNLVEVKRTPKSIAAPRRGGVSGSGVDRVGSLAI